MDSDLPSKQDIAGAIFLAYASRQFHKEEIAGRTGSGSSKDNQQAALGSMALGCAVMACMGIAAYRMAFGDDHCHFHARQFSVLRRKAGRDMVLGIA
jgi:hypothetical protein